MRNAVFLAVILLLTGCDNPADQQAVQARDAVENPKPPLPPAIVPPLEGADPTDPASYEVGIATAAADRNHAKAKCAEMSESERKTCEAEADAAYEAAESGLEDLRGNQE
ncbi:MAG: hypothetical protein ACRES3_10360 [Steroidobacteraceae bacterium]